MSGRRHGPHGLSSERKWALAGVVAAMLSTRALASWAVLLLAAIAPLVAESFELSPVLIGYQSVVVYFVGTAI